jgi:hypothetical protein
MADPHVISALSRKRAELDGELRQAEQRIGQLRADLESIDGALRVFDPSLAPQTIRPKLKRKAPPFFRHGQFSRSVLDLLRRAPTPMTTREIAQQIARDHRLDVATVPTMNRLVNKVRATLGRIREGIKSDQRGDTTVWRAG